MSNDTTESTNQNFAVPPSPTARRGRRSAAEIAAEDLGLGAGAAGVGDDGLGPVPSSFAPPASGLVEGQASQAPLPTDQQAAFMTQAHALMEQAQMLMRAAGMATAGTPSGMQGILDSRQAPAVINYAREQNFAQHIEDEPSFVDMTHAVGAIDMTRAIEPVELGRFREFAKMVEYERFMEEPVGIVINKSGDKNEPPMVFVGVNGDCRWLPRNVRIKLQRKFVERLAAAQEMAYETVDVQDPRADAMKSIMRSTSPAYSFNVIWDPSPYGQRWLARVTRQGS